MKTTTTNKFDYPTSTSHGYKIYKNNQVKEADFQLQKIKYREFDKQQRDIERLKVQKQKERKQQQQRKQNKKKLQEQLEKKKLQLIQLQKMKNMALEAQKKSHQLAIIRQEQERIMKLQQQRKAKQNQYNAQNRFLQALRRLQDQKDINSRKQKQALLRRKTAEQTQKLQRGKAIKYRQEIQQRQKAYQEQQKRTFTNYKQTLGRTAYNKTIDYTKTCLHNPNIIVPSTSFDLAQSALERAERQNSRNKQKSLQRKAKQQQYNRISAERGRAALEKIVKDRQYQQYVREQQEKAMMYNHQRIEAGKKNSYVGLKPGTLVQMETNKRLRGQQQFQQMFFGGQNPQWFDRPANRYNIVQNKLTESVQKSNNIKNKSVVSHSIGSVGAVVSDSHYSFQSQSINDLTSVKKQQQLLHKDDEQRQPQVEQRRKVIPLPRQIVEQSSPKQNKQQNKIISGSKQKQELSYSQSEDEQM